MYLNFEVDIPKIPGKINYVKKGGYSIRQICARKSISSREKI